MTRVGDDVTRRTGIGDDPAGTSRAADGVTRLGDPSRAADGAGPAVLRRRAAVLGSPIDHSLSPVLHRAAYRALGLDWSYDAIECDETRLGTLLDELGPEFVGLSLTMPLKRAVLPLLDDVSPLARDVGAVNTVTFLDEPARRRRVGDNTDVTGMVAALRGVNPRPAAGRVVVLGAGGTAAAALAAVREFGWAEVGVVVRDQGRAAALRTAADRLGVQLTFTAWPGLAAVADAALVISTVPAGAADRVAREAPLRAGQVVFDVIYHPWPTPLAAAARSAGCTVIGGLELLVRQAAAQVEQWTGRPAPIDAMRAAVRDRLD